MINKELLDEKYHEEQSIKEYFIEQKAQDEKDQTNLEYLKDIISSELYKFINEEMEECGRVYNIEIVKSPAGIKQEGSKYKMYVDQKAWGEDYYTGAVYIELPSQKYLKFNYEM